jgi:transcriptional regulator with PAS, ATPase and Fis domain
MNPQDIKLRYGIIGASAGLDRALQKAIQVAPTDISVLVTGESGVGKEAIPRVIHQLSARKHGPYIAVNCGAIPEGTIDSELFGHEKGSFTGATGSRKGYFEEADGGTIFLDEVGELPLATQVRLLRVLETGEFIRVGSSKAQKTNVRVVAATNVNMLASVEKGRFREDLYYRLNTVEIHLPPLRERKDDIPLIFRKFASDFADKYHQPPVRLSGEANQLLMQFHWPGNIRQLRNLAEQLSIFEGGEISGQVLRRYLPEVVQSRLPALSEGPVSASEFSNEREILYKVLFDMKADLNELKKLTLELMTAGGATAQVRENHAGLIRRMVEEVGVESAEPEIIRPAAQPVFHSEEVFEDQQFGLEDESLSLQDKEVELIRKALDRNRGRRKVAAQELGISERTLYRKIKQFNLE